VQASHHLSREATPASAAQAGHRRRGPKLNEDLIAEIDHIAVLSQMTKHGHPDYPALARAAELSDEGLTAITKRGAEPRPATLRKLAAYARKFDPDYSLLRLVRAAGWIDEGDVLHDADEVVVRRPDGAVAAIETRTAPADLAAEQEILALARELEERRTAAGLSEADVEEVGAFLEAVVVPLVERMRQWQALERSARERRSPSSHKQDGRPAPEDRGPDPSPRAARKH
jgi:hypothetical protein